MAVTLESQNLSTLAISAIIGLAGAVAYWLFASDIKLPPGPRPLPFIGNILQIPTKEPWKVYTQWKKTYGEMISLDMAGQPIVVINSRKIINDLIEKRSSIYSDRPAFEMIKLSHFDKLMVLSPYGDSLRKQRRMVAQDFAQSYVPNYSHLQEMQAALLVRKVLQDPEALRSETTLRIGISILRAAFGYDAKSREDHLLSGGLWSVETFNRVSAPENFLVNVLPALKYLPRWLPGSGFLQTADELKQRLAEVSWNPYIWSKENTVTGHALQPNVCSNVIQNADGQLSEDDQEQLAYGTLTMLGGALDTSISTLMSFLLCMIRHPEVQKKAQLELDSVIGTDRLPLITDKPSLPYVRSVLAEVFRWAPAVPLCVPHVLSKDDTYNDYVFKKGTIFMPNIWGLLHDPDTFPDPMTFKPERFNGDDVEMEKAQLAFGFGRRVCPGRYFADGSMFTLVATFLATCEILPGLNEKGEEVLPKVAYTPGAITFPEAFTIRFKARSTQAMSLLTAVSSVME